MHALVLVVQILRWQIAFPHGEGGAPKVTLTVDGATATLETGTLKKTFQKDVLDAIEKAWGSTSFAIADWPSELCQDDQVVWTVEDGASHTRTICRQPKALHRLGELDSLVSALLSAP